MAAAGWVVLSAGCEQPRTELVARVDSELAWGAGQTVQSVNLTVRRGGPTGLVRSARTTALGTGGERRPLPLLVGILPGDDTDTPLWIEALGCGDPNGCTPSTAVVAQRAAVRFARGQTEEVALLLASACVGVSCGTDQRCGTGGHCESATLATVGPFVGTVPDAAVDARTDGGIGVDRTEADVSPTDLGLHADRTDLGADTGDDAPTLDVPAVDAPTIDLPATDTPTTCGALEISCGGVCVAALRDPMNCGDCGVVCPTAPGATPTCIGGRCGYACDAAHADCDERPSNGCESERATDHANCGACGNECDEAHGCTGGVCTLCPGGSPLWCPGTGCTTRSSDARNCGRCGHVCVGSSVCEAGGCRACPSWMTPIPGGTFTMGATDNANEQPLHAVSLSAFCMDTTEVTVAAYRACITAGQCTTPSTGSECNTLTGERDTHPIVCATWEQARGYCLWRGADLPTEAQWEYAARGTDGRVYPWGSGAPVGRLCGNGNGAFASTCPVGSFASGNSPFGISDMAGNAWEWVADWYGPYPASSGGTATDPTGPTTGTQHVYRGGAWYLSLVPFDQFRAASRSDFNPSLRQAMGFRCARRQ
jgi:formylglycine-generating enzyme required for sulfatase activity